MAGPVQVLIIEDDVGDRKLLRRVLSKCEEVIETAEATTEAEVHAVADRRFDAIFCDNNLPGAKGVDMLPVLRETWPQAAIILMTGQGNEMLAKSAILSGATDYVPKDSINQATVQRLLTNGMRAARDLWLIEAQRQDLATFAEVIVHDFKAPIRALSFLSDQISEDLDAGDYSELRASVDLVGKSTAQMTSMIKSLSDHVRHDRETEFEARSASEIVRHALDLVAAEISESGAEIAVQIAPDLPLIHCDGPKITQTLQNLVANAIKYCGNSTPKIEIAAGLDDAGAACFLVSDNGMGVPEEFRERVFAPFKRIPGRPAVNGSGLGLATCKKNVLLHDGEISCEASYLGGAAFRFSIPTER